MQIIFKTNNDQSIEIEEETSLLRASIRHKAGMPFKCGGGMCGTCICTIDEGIEPVSYTHLTLPTNREV